MGIFIGLNQSLIRTYMGETCADEREKRKLLFILAMLVITGIVVGPSKHYSAICI